MRLLIGLLAAVLLSGCSLFKAPPVVSALTSQFFTYAGYGCQLRGDERDAFQIDVGWIVDVACSLIQPYYKPVPDNFGEQGAQDFKNILAVMCEQPELYEAEIGGALRAFVSLSCHLATQPGIPAAFEGGMIVIQPL